MTQFLDEFKHPGPGDPDPRRFLDHLPGNQRGTFANWLHAIVRDEVETPHAACSGVCATIQRRLQWSSSPERRAFLLHCLEILRNHQDEALAYAKSIIEYERIPYAERQRAKAQRSLQYLKTSMVGKPATEAQHGLLRRLGYAGALPEDRAAASELIDRLLTQQGGGR